MVGRKSAHENSTTNDHQRKSFMHGHEKFYIIEGGGNTENYSHDEHILIIENGKVVFQNAASLKWGKIIGESLCMRCVSAPCNPHECALVAAERTGKREERWRFIRGIYYRITAIPMAVGKSIYYFVSAKRTTEPYLAQRLRWGGNHD